MGTRLLPAVPEPAPEVHRSILERSRLERSRSELQERKSLKIKPSFKAFQKPPEIPAAFLCAVSAGSETFTHSHLQTFPLPKLPLLPTAIVRSFFLNNLSATLGMLGIDLSRIFAHFTYTRLILNRIILARRAGLITFVAAIFTN